ncbi:MAG: beta-aspartyl-peptidase [Bacillaceae bacterium]|nr:beta-aspartyl-peptidase [Bacillaceae bacterium]
MITIIKNGEVYAPDCLGKKDIVVVGERIGYILDHSDNFAKLPNVTVIDAADKFVIPGLIDGHVHITGGGGEGSFHTRTPELQLTDATMAGVTTIVGVIGTDGTTRTMTDLVAKAKALREEGISCYALTGSYQVPVRTLTGKVDDDIMLIEEIIGAGEIAIADHRSSQPTREELAKIASQARVGGMLSGKAGVVNVHVGGGKDRLALIEEVVETTNVPITQFYPTHINRNQELLKAGIEFAKRGGYVDFTTSTIPEHKGSETVKSSEALAIMLEAGVPIEQITFTSDAQGSLPKFDARGNFTGLQVGEIRSLFDAVREAVIEQRIPLEQAVRVVTSNPAKVLKLAQKGRIEEGKDADLVILDRGNMHIDTVIARGKIMVQEGEPIVKGTFET